MTKGDWKSELLNSCCERADWAVYCGKSAGAIIAGSRVETATWKVSSSHDSMTFACN